MTASAASAASRAVAAAAVTRAARDARRGAGRPARALRGTPTAIAAPSTRTGACITTWRVSGSNPGRCAYRHSRRLDRAFAKARRATMLALLRDARVDLRYAVRLFARQPAILLLTIVGLSLGLGIATAAFSIMNAAALRGEGLVDPDRAPGVLQDDRSLGVDRLDLRRVPAAPRRSDADAGRGRADRCRGRANRISRRRWRRLSVWPSSAAGSSRRPADA